ncbi:chromate resistance protein ChrB domain-containing protein [Sulfitobacter sp. S190]|uniref:chromate resistance protein ChrB domain-containing protein n=1 Tax=Sulfitobacter sp. S190 TaxID=2867022 RepID=UPI0021A3C49C|nr:chromate resistance protein ChrB domain-containing protein [Sulfitobacter sp. S190]UWR23886.1 chromate resistance protein [Sulfitobacter sp. S190]
MVAFNEITPPQLMRQIGLPDAPALIDVTTDADFAADPFLIPTARRFAFDDTDAMCAYLQDRRAVVICQKGRKLSHGAAARLRARGIAAQVLEGGNHGWRDTKGAPRLPAEHVASAGCWVTRQRPKIDRIACPWLIRRFINPAADILFVPAAEVEDVALRFDAQPFDTADAFWSHRGDHCTFDTMLIEFGLCTPALARMAKVIRAADTGTPEICAQAAGLLAISVGLSRQFRDDVAQMNAGFMIYDALYRWARDGTDETHRSFVDDAA